MPLDRLAALLTSERAARLEESAVRARAAFGDRVVWHVNATAHGGGVAEMLQMLLAYGRGAGVENRWLVIDGDPEFFAITKRLHNLLHGDPGDGGAAGAAEHDALRGGAASEPRGAASRVVARRHRAAARPADRRPLRRAARDRGRPSSGAATSEATTPNDVTDEGWEFLRPYLEHADAFVFSRRVYAPSWIDADRLYVIPPSIDPFSAKNVELSPAAVAAVLATRGPGDRRRPRRPGRLRAAGRHAGDGAAPTTRTAG